jgi:hypothetical protein
MLLAFCIAWEISEATTHIAPLNKVRDVKAANKTAAFIKDRRLSISYRTLLSDNTTPSWFADNWRKTIPDWLFLL